MVFCALILGGTSLAPAPHSLCNQVVSKGLRPLHRTAAYLRRRPDLDALSGPGCQYILNQLRALPEISHLLRALTLAPVSGSQLQCAEWMQIAEYRCPKPEPGRAWKCIPQSHFPCLRWTLKDKNGAKHAAMLSPEQVKTLETSTRIDALYAKIQALCVTAFAQKEEAEKLADLIEGELSVSLLNDSEEAWAKSCQEPFTPQTEENQTQDLGTPLRS